jgi:lipopolysaccharide assembly outer membrane protein LptD (OstA)
MTCQVSLSEVSSTPDRTQAKHIVVPMPKGRVYAEADEIDKNWSSHIVHLKGNVHVKVYTATKDPRGAMVMQAEEVDLNESTGDISPRGDVRLTIEEAELP